MAKKKDNQTEVTTENNDATVENLETQNTETTNEVLEPVVLENNQTEVTTENNDATVEPLKAEIIEPKTEPLRQNAVDGTDEVKGLNYNVSVSEKTARIISKFK